MFDSSHVHSLTAEFVNQIRGIRADYCDSIVDATVEKFAWERVQKTCTAEKRADPRWAEEGPKFIRYLLLEEILLCNEARKGLKKRNRRSTRREIR